MNLSGTVKEISLIIRAITDLNLFSERLTSAEQSIKNKNLSLLLRVCVPNQISVSDEVETVASTANLLIHLKPSSHAKKLNHVANAIPGVIQG